MRAIATTTTTPAIAANIINNTALSMWTEGVVQAPDCICQDDWHGCSCIARFHSVRYLKQGLMCSPDCYGAEYGFSLLPDGGVEYFGNTCGGHCHALRVWPSGRLEAEHIGARSSSGSIMFDHLPPIWWDVCRKLDWSLTTYETSEPTWAVCIAVAGVVLGEGPTCAFEADWAESASKEADLRRKYEAVGRAWPNGLYHDPYEGWCMKTEWDGRERGAFFPVPYRIPTWTGNEYRRARANGVTL